MMRLYRTYLLETGNRGNIEPKLNYAISLINNLDNYILNAPVEVKIKLLGSIFDGKEVRTNSRSM